MAKKGFVFVIFALTLQLWLGIATAQGNKIQGTLVQDNAGGNTGGDVHSLLQTLSQRTASTESLYTTFTQEKKLSVLTQPLQAQGYMCVQKESETQAKRLVWAYTAPQSSGFASIGGKNYHWNGAVHTAKPASGPEAMALKTVGEHMSAWVQVQPQALQKLYTIKSRESRGRMFLLLRPRQKQNFFASLEVELLPSLDGVQSLLFTEKSGDTMHITFAKPKRNQALPAPCFGIAQ